MKVCRWAGVKTVWGQVAAPSACRCNAANQAPSSPDSFRRTHVSFPWRMESRRIYGKHNYSDIDSPRKCRNRVPAGYNVPRLPLQCKLLMSSRGSLALFPHWVDASRLQPALDHPAASQSIPLHDSISCWGAAGWWSHCTSMRQGKIFMRIYRHIYSTSQ